MIFESMKLLVEELNGYLNSFETQSDDTVVLGNIAQIEQAAVSTPSAQGLLNKVVLTLINIEEEKTLKNLPNYKLVNNSAEYANPPVHLNLYILFSATSSSYENALKYLSRVIQFFQMKRTFTQQNSPLNNQPGIQMESFKLILDLYSPSLEETNFLWSTMGGKQLPSVIYKVRMIKIEGEGLQETRGVIVETTLNRHSR